MATVVLLGRDYDFPPDELDGAYLALMILGYQGLPKNKFVEIFERMLAPNRLTIFVAGRQFFAPLADVKPDGVRSGFLRVLTILGLTAPIEFYNGLTEIDQIPKVLSRLSSNMPTEISDTVLMELDAKRLKALCETDKRFESICNDKKFLEKHRKRWTIVTHSKTEYYGEIVDQEIIEYSDEKKIILSKDGKILEEEYLMNGKRHRLDGPAFIRYSQDGNTLEEIYYVNGKENRLDGPAYIRYYDNGNKQLEEYYINGEYYRADGPSLINYYENGNKSTEEYYVGHNRNRLNGPSLINYYENGNIKYEEYRVDDKLHRSHGPAVIHYYQNGKIEREEYWLNDKRQRVGAANVGYDQRGVKGILLRK
jgi:antitoxin component YwqK of YwqJK toxin-antitoxin module